MARITQTLSAQVAGPPSGAAGGDLAGSTYPNPVVSVLSGDLNHDGANAGFFAAVPAGQPTDIGAFTDNIGGAVNVILDAIPDPADLPASVDALRDDLVANALPQIRDALSTIASQVGGLRTRLQSLGLMA